MMDWTRLMKGPCAIRYPRKSVLLEEYPLTAFTAGKWEVMINGTDCALLAVGTMVPVALETAKILNAQHIKAMVVNASTIKPLDEEMLQKLQKTPIITLEEHVLACGFGSAVAEHCIAMRMNQPLMTLGIPDKIVGHGSREELLSSLGLVPGQIAARIKAALNGMGKAAP